MKKIFVLAGSDTSGGAGIQADLKAYQEIGVYGMTALTTIVAQNPEKDWAHEVYPMETSTVKAQVKTILDGVGVDLMKTGMLPTEEIIHFAADTIEKYDLKAVVDPVLACKGQDEPLHPENAKALREVLVPKAYITTPNLFEASQLAEMPLISSVEEMKEAAKRIHDLGAKHVIVKGGPDVDEQRAIDVYYDGEEFVTFENDIVKTNYTHGAGCTFASAIAAYTAQGKDPNEAMKLAKKFISKAIQQGFELNQYVGSVNAYANRV
ncbi:bifunctional hydroxymethylpyrimidine kinase/phosphomethylpyrimidine kinase [Halalkalibacillus halophilus]|uniref:bifunctional hydroxymethylpyrimidine kinase/phosphomethylpyrimidine kinase n=1 Tax=Halalkalibacillus halophilus TaxID=392827 RepID=UPI00041EEC31|nr:bifunctional hydroxymethylpyrimidine kinase/phosphomethylpyrimidine kinase [Halalkalibacillus halophilus]